MAPFSPVLLCVVVSSFLPISIAQSVSSSSALSFTNTTLSSSAFITAPPSQITSSLSANASCSSCVIAADNPGLNQVFWFSKPWSVILDTKYLSVTSFNGSNLTAVTNTRTVLGDVATLNPSAYPDWSLMDKFEEYFFVSDVTFVRGTDGSVGTTSFPFGQAFAQVTAIDYQSLGPNDECPLNMAPSLCDRWWDAPINECPLDPNARLENSTSCVCVLNSWYPPTISAVLISGLSQTSYTLDQTYYQPLPSSQINENLVTSQNWADPVRPWYGDKFSAWLSKDESFKSAFPGWENCAFWDAGNGPPAPKIPVAALTTTISTTVHSAVPDPSSTARPANHPTTPIGKSTAQPITQATTQPTTQPLHQPAIQHTTRPENGQTSSDSGRGVNTQESDDSSTPEPSIASGSSGDPDNSGTSSSQNDNDPGSSGNADDSAAKDDSDPQSSGKPGTEVASAGSSGDIGSSEVSEDTANALSVPHTGYQGGGVTFGGFLSGIIGSHAQGQGNTETHALSRPSTADLLHQSAKPNTTPQLVPFVVTAGGQTVSGTILGSTAAVVAGTTIVAGSSPSSAGGNVISVHAGASSIAVNGDSQPLPIAESGSGPAPIATIGGQTLNALPGASGIYFSGATLSPNGAHATIDGTDIYIGSSGLIIAGSQTIALPTASTRDADSGAEPGVITFTAAGQTFTSSPSGIFVGGTTIASGSTAVIHGTTIAYSQGSLAIGTSTIPIPTPHPSFARSGSSPTHIFTLGGQTFTANPTAIAISGTTLTANGPALTISGTAVSLDSSGIVIASSTYAISRGALPSSTTVIDGETFTIDPTAIQVDGTTLTEGGSAITVHGTGILLGPSGLVVAGSTVPYQHGPLTDASQTSEGLGAIILAGFGSGPSSTSIVAATGTSTANQSSTLATFHSNAPSLRKWITTELLGPFSLGVLIFCTFA